MGTKTIDTAMAKRMVEASVVRGASIIGQPGGWSVVLKLGLQEKPLGVQRIDTPRTWRSLDRCVDYLKNELKIDRFELLDATNFSSESVGRKRDDASVRLRRAHEAAAHVAWFRAQVDAAIVEADAPDAEWISQDEASYSWQERRQRLLKKISTA